MRALSVIVTLLPLVLLSRRGAEARDCRDKTPLPADARLAAPGAAASYSGRRKVASTSASGRSRTTARPAGPGPCRTTRATLLPRLPRRHRPGARDRGSLVRPQAAPPLSRVRSSGALTRRQRVERSVVLLWRSLLGGPRRRKKPAQHGPKENPRPVPGRDRSVLPRCSRYLALLSIGSPGTRALRQRTNSSTSTLVAPAAVTCATALCRASSALSVRTRNVHAHFTT
jgi:hypothetical protein